MARTKSRRRKILILLATFVALIGLTIVGVPVWFPWLARPVGRAFGFEYEEYRRKGLQQFEVTGVAGRAGDVAIEIDRVTAMLPSAWLWRLWRSETTQQDYITADGWTVRIVGQERTGDEPRIQSTAEVMDAVDRIAQSLRKWIPSARLSHGIVQLEGLTATVPELTWRAGRLEAGAQVPEWSDRLSLRIETGRPGQWEIVAEDARNGLSLTTDLARESASWGVDGALLWALNRVEFGARFDASGWLPGEATLVADDLSIPAEQHRLPMYGPIRGSVDFEWRNETYALAIEGSAMPSPTSGGFWPQLDFGLGARGDLERTFVERVLVQAPWFDLGLAAPAEVGHAGPELVAPATLDLNADLAGIHPAFTGSARAEIVVRPAAAGRYPTAELRVESSECSLAGWAANDVEASGRFEWPLVELTEARLSMGEDVMATATGAADLRAREVRAAVVEVAGGDLAGLLPGAMAGRGLRARLEAAGPFDQITHHGEVRLEELILRPLNPLAISLRWEGLGIETVTSTADAEAGESRLSLTSRITRRNESPFSGDAEVEGLTFQRAGVAVFELGEPARVRWDASETRGMEWHLDELRWISSSDAALIVSGNVHWPDLAHVNVEARHFDISEFRDFAPDAAWPVTISGLELGAGWTNGPVHWDMEASCRAELPEGQRLEVEVLARGDDSGTTVERLSLGGWEAPPLTSEGHLPLVLEIGSATVARLLPEAPLDFRVRHEPVDSVRVNLGRTGRFQLLRPSVDLRISGSVDQPRGELIAALDGIESLSPASTALPRMEQVRIGMTVQPQLVQLKQFDFVLEGQPVSVSGELPMIGGEQLDFGAIAPDWLGATGRVSILDAEVSPVAQRFPDLLTAQGRLGLDLVLRPGLMMEGFLTLTNAMSRPLGPLAPVRDIDTVIAFSGRTALIERFDGRLGGRPIRADGEVSLSDDGQLSYGLRIQATNAPLVRRPGLLVRADLDLALENRGGEVPTVSGKVGLRDGLLLQDVSALLVDRLERPTLRPPYFSVTNQPFARWRLNVDVTGDRFLRLRSPAFIGEVSANGSLQGTLGKPVVRAEVRVPRGRLLFPFGKLEVETAYITVSGEQPAGPMIDFVAAGQNFSYNVRLEAAGTMENLNILFTSTPPLSSEDILLMLTAGELPNQEITYSAEARAGRLVTYLGREVATRFFGNELGEERLIVNSGENIARSGRTTYSIEYRLSPRWSLVGEYDEFNALNAGLKFRVFSR